MKRFRFKMAALLKYKTYQERLARQETARAQMDVKECESGIRRLENTRTDQTDKIENILEKGTTASDFRRCHDYLGAVERMIKDETGRRVQLKKVLDDKIRILTQKSVDKKAMEFYRDRQRTLYNQSLVKAEQKEVDEISSLKTARNRSDGTI